MSSQNGLDRCLRESLREFATHKRYLVGVSGGRDSVTLVHLLVRRGYGRLIVCHLDHALRGRAARADALFVRRMAQRLGLEFEEARVDVRKRAAEMKCSEETAGRVERFKFFTAVARRRRCHTIFLGHHADDQVETFLMRLFRGAGARGLGAMRPISQHGSLQVVRPMLGLWREEIDEFVRQERLKFREDATNAKNDAGRNRWRNEIIPWLEKQLGRPVRENIWRTANILAEEESLLKNLLPNEQRTHDFLSVQALRELPLALQRRAIARWLGALAVPDVNFQLIEKTQALIPVNATAARTNLPRDRFVRRRAGKLFIEYCRPTKISRSRLFRPQ